MKWSESVVFHEVLANVALVRGAPAQDWAQLLCSREEAAYERGRVAAQAELVRQFEAQRAELVAFQRGTLASLNSALADVVRDSEGALIRLALETARRVVAAIPIDAQMIEAVVREALLQVKDTAEILVQLHPDDLAALRKNDSTILNGLPDKGPLRFLAASDITRGGCVVQTRFGLIDAQREAKMEQLAQTLNA